MRPMIGSGLLRQLYTGLLLASYPLLKSYLRKERLNELSDAQRAGQVSPSQQPVIWAHCASVGEVLAAEPLLRQLIKEHPDKRLVVTTMTATGGQMVRDKLPEACHYLLPLDLPWTTQRFIRTLSPLVGLVFETELWPNLIHACQRADVPLVLLNGRLSDKAFQRYRRLRPLVSACLHAFQVVAAKSAEDAERFRILGGPGVRIEVTGSIKFDLQPDPTQLAEGRAMRQAFGDRPVWIAASTHEGEETLLLEVHRQWRKKQPRALLILVPRHQPRFDSVAGLLDQQGWQWTRHSERAPIADSVEVLLGDTLGEMMCLYAAADIAFVGGSLVPIGGHNLLEPAAAATPCVTGPYLDNFLDIAALMRAAKALEEVGGADVLPDRLQQLYENPGQRAQLVEAGLAVVAQNQGALARQYAFVTAAMQEKEALD